MAYIYLIKNKINGKGYVGKTQLTISERWRQHCSDAFKPRCEKRPLYAAIRKYGIENFEVSKLEQTDKPNEREIYWIEKLGTFHDGYNATHGGDGKSYLDHQLIIDTYQKVQSCTDVAKILGCNEDSVSNVLKNANIEVLSSHEVAKRKFSKAVNQYTIDTHEFLTTYNSLTDAEKALNKPKGHTHIADCCYGRRKSAYGYYWQFVE